MRLALLLSLLVLDAATAADRPIGGDALVLKDPPARRALAFRSGRDPGIDPAAVGDPRAAGATVEIAGADPGDGTTGEIALDPSGWRGLGSPPGARGWRWTDPARRTGVAKIVLRTGRDGGTLRMSGGGASWPYRITQPQGVIDVRFTVGDEILCAKFTAFARNRPGRVRARRAPAPTSCSPGVAAVCGDGLAQPPEECDDGNTTAGDGCSATCQLESAAALCAG
ncbi:MAG TPA: myxococcus cysteine-rich repeat containing protein, partial [Candidatus Binatia bacterium]|nr:myxococcus cysteine-rich repeat containing protein [Candidatus Binatia bacterium]